MANDPLTVLLKRSSVAGKAPTSAQIQAGEIALNTADGLAYMLTAANSIVAIGALAASGVTAGSYGHIAVSAKGVLTYARALSASDITTALAFTPVSTAAIGVASGIASLDGNGKLPSAQLPTSITGAVVYQGTWNASTNSLALASGTGTKGNYYKVSTAGSTTLDGVSAWSVGDTVIFDGTTWDKIDGVANEVLSVNGLTGVVSITTITGNAATATRWASPVTISATGDVTGAVSIDGSANVSLAGTLASVGTAGSYTSVTTDAKGRVTAGANLVVTGDVTGTASGSTLALTLAASGVTAGSYNNVVVNAKGIITAASLVAYVQPGDTIDGGLY